MPRPTLTSSQSTTSYAYQGNQVTVTDPAGNSKIYTMSAFGNLLTVQESDPTSGAVTTSYTYDVLNHLTGVSMPRGSTTQTRTFTYNSGTTVLGLLQSATNPETGTVKYTYNTNTTLASKTDDKGQKFTYAYDAYNRLTSISVNSTLLRTFIYGTNSLDNTGFSQNTIGRLAAVQYPANAQGIQFNDMYSYVAAGTSGAGLPAKKRLQVNQALNGSSGPYNTQTLDLDAAYTYNNEGSVASTTYPTTYAVNANGALTGTAGPAYTYSFDSLYRPSGLTTTVGNSTIVSGVTYGPANQLLSLSYNGLSEYRSYNSLLQLTSVYTTNGVGPLVNMQYNYPAAPNNNGKACLAADAVTGEQIVYSYDSLNRHSSASAYTFSGSASTNCAQTTGSTSTWAETYAFDGFGNLTNKAGTGGAPNVPIGVNPTNNQITDGAPQYDANGNLTAQSGVSYTYDPENRMSYFSSVSNGNRTFGYDSQNKRILNWSGSTDQNGNASGYTVYYYGVKGERLGVYNFMVGYWAGGNTPTLENSTTSTETFFGARRLAPLDRLGSARSVNSTASSYYPFGEDKSTNPAIDAWKFGSYWRDSASGLDYATNRYYSSTLARFLTPDLYTAGVATNTPSSWNLYSYTRGEPVNNNDPSGLCLINSIEYPDGMPPCPNDTSVTVNGSLPVIPGPGGGSVQTSGSGEKGKFTPPAWPPPPCTPAPVPPQIASNQLQNMIQEVQTFYQNALEADGQGALFALAGYLAGGFMEGGQWDYKHFYVGTQYYTTAQNFGNFSFGATLESLGFTYAQTQNIAGLVQILICLTPRGACGEGIPFLVFPYGDQTLDAAVIWSGFDYEQAVQAGKCQ